MSIKARRAQSFSDFFYVATNQAKKESKKGCGRALEKVKTELDFQDWYKDVEDKLLDASLEKYRCVHINLFSLFRISP